jgi:hypothetical protein
MRPSASDHQNAGWPQGIWAAVPTPFLADQSLDLDGIARNVRHFRDALGLAGIFCNGLMGERVRLSLDSPIAPLAIRPPKGLKVAPAYFKKFASGGLAIEWLERGGPTVIKPSHWGYGTRTIHFQYYRCHRLGPQLRCSCSLVSHYQAP